MGIIIATILESAANTNTLNHLDLRPRTPDQVGYALLCPELDIASQAKTVTNARENLGEALAQNNGVMNTMSDPVFARGFSGWH